MGVNHEVARTVIGGKLPYQVKLESQTDYFFVDKNHFILCVKGDWRFRLIFLCVCSADKVVPATERRSRENGQYGNRD